MLCKTCQTIDFNSACGSPENTSAKHHDNYDALLHSATQGCELCIMICDTIQEQMRIYRHSAKDIGPGEIRCNVWNWYNGPIEEYKGSACILFHQETDFVFGWVWSAKLEIFADAESEPAVLRLVSGRSAHASADSESCYSLSRMWIRECTEEHKDSCPHSSEHKLPTRVIDVGNEANNLPPFVLVTNNKTGEWVSLSHCWGREARFVTETSNLKERTQGLVMEELPRTFYDAILATRRLGYQYLWIDSLCILQDSAEDWASEASKMQEYYSQAVLTLASDIAEGDHQGFLDNVRPKIESVEIPFNHKSLSSPSHVYIKREEYREPAQTNTRAWCLQEDILSPRSLHYATGQLVFECRRQKITETDMTPQNDVDQSNATKSYFLSPESGFEDDLLAKFPSYAQRRQPMERWYNLFAEYCERTLTFENDRLIAISGLVKTIEQQSGYTYKAGIFLEDIHLGLLWTITGRAKRDPNVYRAPSWSWASIEIEYWGWGVYPGFSFYRRPRNWKRDLSDPCPAELISCELKTENDMPDGKILSGYLKLRGLLLSYSGWRSKTRPYRNTWWSTLRSHHLQRRFSWKIEFLPPRAPDQLILDLDTIDSDGESNASDDGESTLLDGDASHEEPDASDDGESVSVDGDASQEEESYINDEENENWHSTRIDKMSLLRIAKYYDDNWEDVPNSQTFYALMLIPLDTGDDKLLYRRIGVAEVPDFEDLAYKDWEMKEVTII